MSNAAPSATKSQIAAMLAFAAKAAHAYAAAGQRENAAQAQAHRMRLEREYVRCLIAEADGRKE